ncbi:ABC transporter permease [Salinispora cortesiana]|uniref:ABC transporter permease n=1 Tax=Salinispora cortesiana TaxID=1305843 RepID=UPI0012BCBE5A|nr:FtsX-like permease family protein [Salinispora cortesiana]
MIILMLAIPAFAASILLLAWSDSYASVEREASWQLGRANLLLDGAKAEEAMRTAPAGTATTELQTGRTILTRQANHTTVEYWATDVAHPINTGKYVLRDGLAASTAGEVALTRSLARKLDVQTGDTIQAGLPQRTLRVVGLIDTANQLGREALIVPAAHPLSTGASTKFLLKLPDTRSTWIPDKRFGVGMLQRSDLLPDAQEQVVRVAGLTLVVGFAGMQIVLLVGAAFAVGARRQQRELAMVGAVGATHRQVARLVLANGVVLGLCAGVFGCTSGLGVYWVSRPLVERLVDHPLAEDGLPLMPIAGVALIAVLIGVAAAVGPARGVSRAPIRHTLIGRQTSAHRSGRRFLGAGIVTATLGVALASYSASPAVASATLAAAGAVLVLVGLVAMAPAAVELTGRAAPVLPLAPRLAVRHAARHQFRTAAAIAAVCGAVAGSVGISLFLSADTRTGTAAQPDARPGQVLIDQQTVRTVDATTVEQIRDVLPVKSVVTIQETTATASFNWIGDQGGKVPPDLPQTVAIGGPEVVEAVTGAPPPPDAIRALEDGLLLAFHPFFIVDGVATVTTKDGRELSLDGRFVPTDNAYRRLPSVLVSPVTAQKMALQAEPADTVLTTTRPPTAHELAKAESVLLGGQLRGPGTKLTTPGHLTVGVLAKQQRQTDPIVYVLAVVSAIVTLLAGSVAVGLATSEMRDDLSTLAAVGAPPRISRWLAASQAGLIIGTGTLLGLLAGVAPAAGLVALREDLTWHLPWWLPIVMIIGLPVIAVLGTAASIRSRLTLTRRLN